MVRITKPKSNFMPLTSASKLDPDAILATFVAADMGEVYKARDTRLDFLINTEREDSSKSPIIVIIDWTAAIEEGTSTP